MVSRESEYRKKRRKEEKYKNVSFEIDYETWKDAEKVKKFNRMSNREIFFVGLIHAPKYKYREIKKTEEN
jgi:hypothetical protein